jgi:hypothetical protein
MANAWQATVAVSGWRKHRCEHCGQKFAYPITRTGTDVVRTNAVGSELAASREAKKGARAAARARLRSEFDCVPCPKCGEFQSAMVAALLARRTRVQTVLTRVLAALAVLVGLVAVVFTQEALKARAPNEVGHALCAGAWALTTTLTLGAIAAYAFRRRAVRTFDPYKGLPAEYWIERARKLGAVTEEEYARLETEHAAQPEQKPVIAEEPTNPFTGDGAKPWEPTARQPPVAPPAQQKPWDRGSRPAPSPDNPFQFDYDVSRRRCDGEEPR